MQYNIHSCLRLEEWVLITSMMPGGSQTLTPILSKFKHGNICHFFVLVCLVSYCIFVA